MAKYQVSEAPIENLSPDQIRAEAAEIRHQLSCVDSDIAAKRAWYEADAVDQTKKVNELEYRTWMAKAKFFRGKLAKRYSLVRGRERKLNRAEYTSNRHVTRAEFVQLKKELKP